MNVTPCKVSHGYWMSLAGTAKRGTRRPSVHPRDKMAGAMEDNGNSRGDTIIRGKPSIA